MTTASFIKKVEYMRKLQKRYFQLRKDGQAMAATTVLRECKAVESQVDDELPTQLVMSETPKLF